MSQNNKVVNLMDAWLKKQGIGFSFIPNSKGYPEYRDPAAERPVGILSPGAGEGEIRRWKNRYAPHSANT